MVLCVVVIVLIVFAMIAVTIIIYTQSRIVNLVYAGICVVLFSLVRQVELVLPVVVVVDNLN